MASKTEGAIPVEKILTITRFAHFGTFPNPIGQCLVLSIFAPNPVEVLHEFGVISKVDDWGNHGRPIP